VSEINEVIDRWSSVALTAEARKHGLALELAGLDELQQTFYEKALGGDIASGDLVEKVFTRRCVGLHAPQTAVLKIVEESTLKETASTRLSSCSPNSWLRRRTTIRQFIRLWIREGTRQGNDKCIW